MLEYYEHLCACGCGGQIEIKEKHRKNKIPKYINGHSRKNIKMAEEQKMKIRLANIGKKRTEETKSKIKKARSGQVFSEKTKQLCSEQRKGENNPFYGSKKFMGKNNPFYGKKHTEEARKKQANSHIGLLTGDKNPNWNNGSSFGPYPPEFNKQLKQSILERDNNVCQNPNCNVKEKTDLHLHHIDYNKNNNDKENLITLCNSCHSKTTGKRRRDFYIEFYQNIVINKILDFTK